MSLRVRPAVAFDCLFNSPFPPSVTNGEFSFYIKSTESFKQTKNLRFWVFIILCSICWRIQTSCGRQAFKYPVPLKIPGKSWRCPVERLSISQMKYEVRLYACRVCASVSESVSE